MLINIQTIKAILEKYNIQIKGILHLGAHICEEKSLYNNLNVSDDNIIWVDADDELVEKNIKNGIKHCYTAALDSHEHDAVFNITNHRQSSSLLEFGIHDKFHPDHVVVKRKTVKTDTLHSFFSRTNLNPANYNIWNFDIQGSELNVLKGAPELLIHVDLIYTEVNTDQVYKQCGLLNEMDAFLDIYGFTRIEIKMWADEHWGDAIYIKK